MVINPVLILDSPWDNGTKIVVQVFINRSLPKVVPLWGLTTWINFRRKEKGETGFQTKIDIPNRPL
jgi:hypothetical protein